MAASFLRVCVVASILGRLASSLGLSRARVQSQLARTVNDGPNEVKGWHEDLGKGLAQEHNVDTKQGQLNSTHTYKSVEDRVMGDTLQPGTPMMPPEAAKAHVKAPMTTVTTTTQAPKAEEADDDSDQEKGVASRVEQEKMDVSGHVEAGGEETLADDKQNEAKDKSDASGRDANGGKTSEKDDGKKPKRKNVLDRTKKIVKNADSDWLSMGYLVTLPLLLLLLSCCICFCCLAKRKQDGDMTNEDDSVNAPPAATPVNADGKTDGKTEEDNMAEDNSAGNKPVEKKGEK